MPASDYPTSLATIADTDLVTIKRDFGDGNFIPLEVTGLQLKTYFGSGGGGSTNPIYTGVAPPGAPAFPLQGALFTPNADGAPLQKWIPGTGWMVI